MSEIPSNLKYLPSHEWLRLDDDGTATVGISDHAQEALGDLVFVELPEVGVSYGGEEACAVVESVKAASDVYCPIAGEVVEINDALADAPELVNEEPYDKGWLFHIKVNDAADADGLLDAEKYAAELDD